MLKNQKIYFFLFLVILLIVPVLFVQASVLPASDSFKGIVKIYTYEEDLNYSLTPSSSGSGIIISSDGLILTNHHVVSSENNFGEDLSVAFRVCLTTTTTDEPDCRYSADLISKEKNRDMALLKIKPVSGVSTQVDYDHIAFGNTENIKEGDAVKALGYPRIGGDTITITSGTVSGTLEKYASSWIKTDTSFSFGSSGGALVGDDGKLLGITTAAHSDLLGSMGYVININSIKGWIDENKTKSNQVSSLQSRIEALIKKQQELKQSNKFNNTLPAISIQKNADWSFDFEGENSLDISHKDDEEQGVLSISWSPTPLENASSFLDAMIEILVNEGLYMLEGDTSLGGKSAKKIAINFFGEEFHQILTVSNNYLIAATFYYGENNLGYDSIQAMLDSIVISDAGNNFKESRYYEHQDPYFRLNTTKDWALMKQNSKTRPLIGSSVKNSFFDFGVTIEKLSASLQNASNADFFNYLKNNNKLASNEIDADAERYFESTKYEINDELYNEIFYKYRYKSSDNPDKIKAFSAGFVIREGDKSILISFEYYGDDEALWEQYLKDFQEKELVSLSLGRPTGVRPPADDDGDDFDFYWDDDDDLFCFDSECYAQYVDDDETELPLPSQVALEAKELTSDMGLKLRGKILLQVESNGEAWYLSPITTKAYFLGRPDDAFRVMREQGVGISNSDLEKIPVGLLLSDGALDSDGDGLSDLLEDAIGTDKYKKDTDGDGYDDYTEIMHGYDPRKSGGAKMPIDLNFANKHKGKIFLQVENNGEAWYVNPADGKRYFLGRPTDAFQAMRALGLGISNENFDNL